MSTRCNYCNGDIPTPGGVETHQMDSKVVTRFCSWNCLRDFAIGVVNLLEGARLKP